MQDMEDYNKGLITNKPLKPIILKEDPSTGIGQMQKFII